MNHAYSVSFRLKNKNEIMKWLFKVNKYILNKKFS